MSGCREQVDEEENGDTCEMQTSDIANQVDDERSDQVTRVEEQMSGRRNVSLANMMEKNRDVYVYFVHFDRKTQQELCQESTCYRKQ